MIAGRRGRATAPEGDRSEEISRQAPWGYRHRCARKESCSPVLCLPEHHSEQEYSACRLTVYFLPHQLRTDKQDTTLTGNHSSAPASHRPSEQRGCMQEAPAYGSQGTKTNAG